MLLVVAASITKGNLDLSQTPDAFKSIVKNQCLDTSKSVTDNPPLEPKKAEVIVKTKLSKKVADLVLTALEKRTLRLDLARFAKDFSGVARELENTDLQGGVSIAQHFVWAKREAKLNGIEPQFNNAFVGAFLGKFVDQNKNRKLDDIKIRKDDYSNQITAGKDAVKAKKIELAARGPLPQNFETGMGPITPSLNLYTVNNPVEYKKLAVFCQKNGVNFNTFFDKAELEASQMADKKYQPAYLTGYFKELISLIEKNDGKISKDMDRVFDKQLNNAGEQAAAIAAKADTLPVEDIKPVKISFDYDYATKNPEMYQKLSDLCTLAGVNPQKVIDNAIYNSNAFILPKDDFASPRLRHDYIKGYVAKFVELASLRGQISSEMMSQQNKILDDAGAQAVVTNARKLDN